jgi:hypothetical protein
MGGFYKLYLLLRRFFAETCTETAIEEAMSLTSDSYIVYNSTKVFQCRGHCAGATMC